MPKNFSLYLKALTYLTAVLSIGCGLGTISGWLIGSDMLRGFSSSWISMKVNTAFGFICCGIILALFHNKQKVVIRVGEFLAVLVGSFSFLTIVQYLFQVDLGIDQIIYKEPLTKVGNLPPGRMAMATAINFLLFSILTFIRRRPTASAARSLYSLSGIGIFIGVLGLVAYFFKVNFESGLGYYFQMAFNTALMFIPLFVITAINGIPGVVLRIESSIRSVFIFGLGLLSLVAAIAFTGYRESIRLNEEVKRTDAILFELESLLMSAVNTETSERGYVITGKKKFLEPYHAAENEIKEAFSQLDLLVQDPLQKENLRLVKEKLDDVRAGLSNIVQLVNKGRKQDAVQLVSSGRIKEKMDGFRAEIDNAQIRQRFLHTEVLKKFEDTSRLTISFVLLGSAVAIALVLFATIAIGGDIKRRNKLELALREASESAAAASRMKSSFLANMSHEIRTPLNGILGMAEILADSSLSEEQKRYAQLIQESGQNLLTIINDILDFSKIEAGRLEFESIPFNFLTVIENQVEILSSRAREKNLVLLSFCDPKIPAQIEGDPGRLGQVLLNLIGNAIKFTTEGKISVLARLESESETEICVRIAVEDTGIGISEDIRTQLFKPFQQADASMARRFGGTGLGLSISKRLVELMNGEIGAEALPARGSRFWFTARFKKSTAPSKIPLLNQSELKDFEVLIVDDDPLSLQILETYMRAWGVQVVTAKSGDEALSRLRERKFSAVLIDKRMPEMDGFTLAKRIREKVTNQDIKLILISAYDRPKQRQNALEEGFNDFLLKPIRQSDLYNLFAQFQSGGKPSPAEQAFVENTQPQRALKILVAEDNSANRTLIQTQLKKLGYPAQIVGNGLEVVEEFKRGSYDLILMDCQMPELDGFEATKRIREIEKTKNSHIPIVALTANAMKEDRVQCLLSGMDDYLSKPFRREQLADVLEKWSKNKREEVVIQIDPVLAEIAPEYLNHKREELLEMQELLKKEAFEKIQVLAHSMKGSGGGYGFEKLTDIGAEMEKAAKVQNAGRISDLLADMEDYLKRVKIKA